MSTHLTKELTELLVTERTRNGGLVLDDFEDASDDSADVLASYRGDLWLNGLRNPSPAFLERLVSVSKPDSADGTAKESQKSPARLISLNAIQSLSLEQARILSNFRGKLSLGGLESITEDCAVILGRSGCFHLYLDGIREISEAILRSLLGPRSVLTLNGLLSLPLIESPFEDLEDVLCELHLNGVRNAAYESLRALNGVPTDFLYLNGLERLPQRDEMLFGEGGAQLFLSGLRQITELDLQIFGSTLASRSLILDGIEDLDAKQAAKLIGTDRCTFGLGLRWMTDDIADIIFRSQTWGCLILDHLEELTPFAAEVCGRYTHADIVSLNGLKQISDEAFERLLADYSECEPDWCVGSFDLNGLTHLTPRMRNLLETTKHDVSLERLRN